MDFMFGPLFVVGHLCHHFSFLLLTRCGLYPRTTLVFIDRIWFPLSFAVPLKKKCDICMLEEKTIFVMKVARFVKIVKSVLRAYFRSQYYTFFFANMIQSSYDFEELNMNRRMKPD